MSQRRRKPSITSPSSRSVNMFTDVSHRSKVNQLNRLMLSIACIVLCCFLYALQASFRSQIRWPNLYSLKQSSNIKWSPCPDDASFRCAFVDVPLNHLNTSDRREVNLALRSYPANCAREEYLGHLWLQPGGPGGSGARLVKTIGKHVSSAVDGRYTIISFDPRGTGLTTPGYDCAKSVEALAISTWSFISSPRAFTAGNFKPEGISDAQRIRFNEELALHKATLDSCYTDGNVDVIRSSSTAFWARDSAFMLDLLGEEKLHYWGVSYGTFAGATFAAMLPQRVGRMILDAVTDPALWHADTIAHDFLQMKDTQAVFESHLAACVRNQAACKWDITSPRDGIEQIDRLSRQLEQYPVAMSSGQVPGIVHAGTLQIALHMSLYSPTYFKAFAESFAAAEKGNMELLWQCFSARFGPMYTHNTTDPFQRNWKYATIGYNTVDAYITVMDTVEMTAEQRLSEAMLKHARELQKISPIGAFWAHCNSIPSSLRDPRIIPYETYAGPWTTAEGLPSPANPILFLNPRLDNVTPLLAAQRRSKLSGPGSGLLIQESAGHSTWSAPSLCTIKAVRAFFLEGEMPEHGKVCDSFPDWPYKSLVFDGLDELDEKLLKASLGLTTALSP